LAALRSGLVVERDDEDGCCVEDERLRVDEGKEDGKQKEVVPAR